MRKLLSWASSCSILFGVISFHLAATPSFASAAGSVASGSLTISGTLQTKPATSGNPGTGSVIVGGSEQSKPGTAATPGSGSITIMGLTADPPPVAKAPAV